MDARRPFPTNVIAQSDDKQLSTFPFAANQYQDAWAQRAEHWIDGQPRAERHGPQRRKLRAPLVLNGYGVHLCINHGALEVKNGFTHYPQRRETWRFFPGDQQRPTRIIVLERGGAVTFDVLAWLAEQDIPLFQVDYRGHVITAVGGTGHAADPELMQAQLAAAADPKRRMALSSWFIREKLVRSVRVLQEFMPTFPAQAATIEQLSKDAALLAERPARTLGELLGIEGRGAKAYFQSWHELPISWRGLNRHPIPDDWHRVGPRSSAKKMNSNRRATHPVHAMLNYAYAVLEGQVRMELVRAGLDVTIGFLHSVKSDRPALVLDVMEPARTVVDRFVLRSVRDEVFVPADFTITPQGVVRLHPQLARRIVSLVGEVEGLSDVVSRLVEKLGWLAQSRSSGLPTWCSKE